MLPNSISIEGDVSFSVGQDTCSEALIENVCNWWPCGVLLITLYVFDCYCSWQVKSTVMQKLSQTSDNFCSNYSNIICNVSNGKATCEEITSLEEEQSNLIKHRKRSLFLAPDSLNLGHTHLSVSTRIGRRETAEATLPRSHINLHFQMTARMSMWILCAPNVFQKASKFGNLC